MHIDKNNNLQFVKLKSIGQIKCIFLQSLQKIGKAAIFLADGHRRVKLSGKFTIYCSFQKLVPLILLLFLCIQIARLTIYSFRNGNLLPLREKCPYLELFWSVFSRIWTEYGPGWLKIRTSQCVNFLRFFPPKNKKCTLEKVNLQKF